MVELLAGVGRGTFGADTANVGSAVEHAEAVAFQHVHQLNKAHIETGVRFVGTIIFHSVGPRHTRQFRKVDAFQCLEKVAAHSFEHLENVLLLNKRHLTVDLSELRLTVCTKVLVAETLDNLEVTVDARNHQQLLERLRALGQSVELSGIHTAWNDKVAGTLGC